MATREQTVNPETHIYASILSEALVDAIRVRHEYELRKGYVGQSAYLATIRDTLDALRAGRRVHIRYGK